MRLAQVNTSVGSSLLASQPLAEREVCHGEIGDNKRLFQLCDGLLEDFLCHGVISHQRLRTGQ